MTKDSVQKDVVVSMEYTLHVDGEEIDSSKGQDPLQFLVGYGNIISGLEREMIVMPMSQAIAANFAPEAMRGRYMAVFGLIWAIPATIGPGAAGYILDNYNPSLLWYLGGLLCTVAVLAYYMLHLRLGTKPEFAPAPDDVDPVPA